MSYLRSAGGMCSVYLIPLPSDGGSLPDHELLFHNPVREGLPTNRQEAARESLRWRGLVYVFFNSCHSNFLRFAPIQFLPAEVTWSTVSCCARPP